MAVPGLAMYILIGRTQDYAWSLTSANHDVRDVFAEELCNPDGSRADPAIDALPVTRASAARSSEFDAGHAERRPDRAIPTSVHGPVIGTATVGGKPYALTRKRSTFGRDGLNLGALKDMTEGKATHAAAVLRRRPTSSGSRSTGPTRRATATAFFTSGLLPERAAASTGGCRRSAPASTSGRASCSRDEHPHDVGGPNGLLLNWNNQSAPGFMHGDDEPYGSVHRVELFDQFPGQARARRRRQRHEPRRHRGRAVAGVARRQRGAPRQPARAERASTQAVVRLLDDWVRQRRAAPRRRQRRASTTTPGRRSWTRVCAGRSPRR